MLFCPNISACSIVLAMNISKLPFYISVFWNSLPDYTRCCAYKVTCKMFAPAIAISCPPSSTVSSSNWSTNIKRPPEFSGRPYWQEKYLRAAACSVNVLGKQHRNQQSTSKITCNINVFCDICFYRHKQHLYLYLQLKLTARLPLSYLFYKTHIGVNIATNNNAI